MTRLGVCILSLSHQSPALYNTESQADVAVTKAHLAVTRLWEGFISLIIAKLSTTPSHGDSDLDKARGSLSFSYQSPALHNTKSQAILTVTSVSFSRQRQALHNTNPKAILTVTRLRDGFVSLIIAKPSSTPFGTRLMEAFPSIIRAHHSTSPSHRRLRPLQG